MFALAREIRLRCSSRSLTIASRRGLCTTTSHSRQTSKAASRSLCSAPPLVSTAAMLEEAANTATTLTDGR